MLLLVSVLVLELVLFLLLANFKVAQSKVRTKHDLYDLSRSKQLCIQFSLSFQLNVK